MPSLHVELNVSPPDRPARWWRFCTLKPEDGEDSLSDNTPEGRDIYVFGINEADDYAYINKIETERQTDQDNPVQHLGYIAVTTLADTESYAFDIQTDVHPEPQTVRFTYVSEADT